MADLTVALTFILAVHSLSSVVSSSKTVDLIRRQDRLRQTSLALANALAARYERGSVRHRLSRSTWQVLLDGQTMAEVGLNGSFVRVSIYAPIWGRRSADVTEYRAFNALYGAVCPIIKDQARDLGALYVHGIVEPRERAGNYAMPLAQARADIVLDLLRRERVVAPFSSSESVEDPSGGSWVPSANCVVWVTGSRLDAWITGSRPDDTDRLPVGRVDLVLLFRDTLDPEAYRHGPSTAVLRAAQADQAGVGARSR